jgi:hypothetical protein
LDENYQFAWVTTAGVTVAVTAGTTVLAGLTGFGATYLQALAAAWNASYFVFCSGVKVLTSNPLNPPLFPPGPLGFPPGPPLGPLLISLVETVVYGATLTNVSPVEMTA